MYELFAGVLDMYCFLCCLGARQFLSIAEGLIYQALKVCDHEHTHLEWVYKEAMDVDSLQNAGTFRNALLRKFDELLTGIFAELIGYINRYNNLLLLAKDTSCDLVTLWFQIFTSESLCQNTILKLVSSPRSEISTAQMINEHYFTCKFPFSWTIFGVIENTLHESGTTIIFS